MTVAELVGRTLVELGADHVFGVVGSGNFHVTNAMAAAGARFVAARHESGAATMADGYARTSGRLGVVSVHQGCGLTNAMTGITEAAKSRTPMIVLAADTAAAAVRSNFRVDQDALAVAVGAISERVFSAASAMDDVVRAYRTAVEGRRTVVLNLPLDVQAAEDFPSVRPKLLAAQVPSPDPTAAQALAKAIAAAQRPVFVAGRGARGARKELELLADRCGALLATSAVANGLFAGNPWSLGISGGFATPQAVELISGADLVVGWGAGLNMWTMRHGALIARPRRLSRWIWTRTLWARTGRSTSACWAMSLVRPTRSRSSSRKASDIGKSRCRTAAGGKCRTKTCPLWTELTRERCRLDSTSGSQSTGCSQWIPGTSWDIRVPTWRCRMSVVFCFTQAYQSIGLGLATAIGAALAEPSRLPIAAVGDGGGLMSIAELDTVVRLRLPMVVVFYNDEAYGAEVHHFGPHGHNLDTVLFPETDIAAMGRGFGADAITVRALSDLDGLTDWLAGPRDRPLVIDAKVTSGPSWWLEEAFRGH